MSNKTQLQTNNAELDTITQRINAIISGSGGSTSGSTSGSGVTMNYFSFTEGSGDEPGTYSYELTSDYLQANSRKVIVIFTTGDNDYSLVYKVLYRENISNNFTVYNGSISHLTNGMNTYAYDDSTIIIDNASITDSNFSRFWFIAM